MKQNKHVLREQAESSGDNVFVCWWYGQSHDVSSWWTTERRQKIPDRGQAKIRAKTKPKKKSVLQRSGGFSLNLYLPGVSRWSGVISHDISRYIVISYPISCDITRYDISRYCIRIPKYWAWHRDIASRRNIPWYRTHFSPIGAPSLVHQESKRRNGYLEVELQKQWYLFENIYVRPYGDTQTVGLDAVPEKKTQ